jgi:hypothetical protein
MNKKIECELAICILICVSLSHPPSQLPHRECSIEAFVAFPSERTSGKKPIEMLFCALDIKKHFWALSTFQMPHGFTFPPPQALPFALPENFNFSRHIF